MSLGRGAAGWRPKGAAGCDRILVRLPKCWKSCPCECGPCVLHGERDLDCARLDVRWWSLALPAMGPLRAAGVCCLGVADLRFRG